MEDQKDHKIIVHSTKANVKETVSFVKITMGIPKAKDYKPRRKVIYLVFDRSYSMISVLTEAMQATKKLIDFTKEFADLTLITYAGSNDVATYDYHTYTPEQLKEKIDNLALGGSTCFRSAFSSLRTAIEKEDRHPDMTVIFVTDGQDTSNPRGNIAGGSFNTFDGVKLERLRDMINLSQNETVDYLDKYSNTAQIHALGLGPYHDSKFLANMVQSDKILSGTSLYVENKMQLDAKLQEFYPYLMEKKMNVSLLVKGTDMPLYFSECDAPEEYETQEEFDELEWMEAQAALTEEPEGEMEMRMKNDDEEIMLKFIPEARELSDLEEADFLTNYLQKEIISATAELGNDDLSAKRIEMIEKNMNELETKLEERRVEAFKIRVKPVRKNIIDKYLETKKILTQFFVLLRKRKISKVTFADIAQMNDLVYSHGIKERFKRQLDKRAVVNIDRFDNLMSKLTTNAKKYENDDEVEKLVEKHESVLELVDRCFMTGDNAMELMQGGDCLCLTLKISRPETAIVDPTRVRILDIHPSFISADSFKSAYEYQVNTLIDPATAHGGFSKEAYGAILKGNANEEINAVFPLYLFEENWTNFGRHWMKLLLGLNVTLDALGFNYEQLNTFPFLVLAKAVNNMLLNDTEHTRGIFKLVFDTCIQIYKDSVFAETSMKTKFTEMLDKYIASPSGRTVDQVPNTVIFMMQLLVAMECGDIEKLEGDRLDQFMKAYVEEENRRFQIGHKGSPLENNLILALLGIDYEKYVRPATNNFENEMKQVISGKSNDFKSKFMIQYKAIGGKIEAMEEEQKATDEGTVDKDDVPEWHLDLTDLTPHAEKLLATLKKNHNKAMDASFRFLAFIVKDGELDQYGKHTLDDFGFDTTTKKLTLSIQNYFHYRNSDRRKGIEDNSYVDPVNADTSSTYLTSLGKRALMETTNKKLNAIKARFEAEMSGADASVFAFTDDLEEAAGALMGTYIGRNINQFYTLLQTTSNNVPHAFEKIKMLIDGNYKGVYFYADKSRSMEGWKPTRSNLHKLWLAHYNTVSKETWKDLFVPIGVHASCIDNWYGADTVDDLYKTILAPSNST